MGKKLSHLPYNNIFWILLCGIPMYICFILQGLFYNYVYFLPIRASIPVVHADDWMYTSAIWISNLGRITIIFLIVLLLLELKNKKNKNGTEGIKYFLFSLIVPIIVWGSFIVLNPRFSIQVFPQVFGFAKLQATEVTNPKTYYFWIDTLGYEYVGYYKFKTLEENIAGLEYAKEHKLSDMYSYIFSDLEAYGYENVLAKYDDEFFEERLFLNTLSVGYGEGKYSYEIEEGNTFFSRLPVIEKILDKTKNIEIKKSLQQVLEQYENYKKDKDVILFFKNVNKIYRNYINLGQYKELK